MAAASSWSSPATIRASRRRPSSRDPNGIVFDVSEPRLDPQAQGLNALEIVNQFTIPAREGRAVVVGKGQVLRIHQIVGGQVGDCVFYNADDRREWFHVGQSWATNVILGTGTSKSFKHFYSKPPRENAMLTTVADTYANHWGNMGGRCSTKLYERRDRLGEHRSCQENLTRGARPLGAQRRRGDGRVQRLHERRARRQGRVHDPPHHGGRGRLYRTCGRKMNVLAAVSACPADTSPHQRRQIGAAGHQGVRAGIDTILGHSGRSSGCS